MREAAGGEEQNAPVELQGRAPDRLPHETHPRHGRQRRAECVHEDGHEGSGQLFPEQELERLQDAMVDFEALRTSDVDT